MLLFFTPPTSLHWLCFCVWHVLFTFLIAATSAQRFFPHTENVPGSTSDMSGFLTNCRTCLRLAAFWSTRQCLVKKNQTRLFCLFPAAALTHHGKPKCCALQPKPDWAAGGRGWGYLHPQAVLSLTPPLWCTRCNPSLVCTAVSSSSICARGLKACPALSGSRPIGSVCGRFLLEFGVSCVGV